MNINFTKNKRNELCSIKEIKCGSVFIYLNEENIYIKINQYVEAVNLATGEVAYFNEDYKARVLKNDEYEFEVFI